ncbi:MAG: hypothetical protein IKR63_06970 [Alloprevotella sp.]|nr:hypothetical protein [Alloprevotella sp.]MBR6339849.1 hypothetical protein [Alloprevotella sp.]
MKRILLTAVVALLTLSASAQVYIGGAAGFWRNPSDNTTQFKVAPEVGYCLSNKWAVGMALGYQYNYDDGASSNSVAINPYARFTFAKFGPVSLFADGGFELGVEKPKNFDSAVIWGVGVKPGVAVGLTEKLSFVSHLGFLGYRGSNDNAVTTFDGFGVRFDATDVNFGLYYNF